MTHAYQEIYLSNAQALLGDAFDYAINACGVAGDSFIKLFSVSSVSNRIENSLPIAMQILRRLSLHKGLA